MIILFEKAKEQGLSKFFTGIPCKNGHISERYVCSKSCVVCSYQNEKKYKNANKEKTTCRRQDYRNSKYPSGNPKIEEDFCYVPYTFESVEKAKEFIKEKYKKFSLQEKITFRTILESFEY